MTSEVGKGYFIKILAKVIIWMLLAYGIGFSIWTIFFTETGNGDNVEHIHATWLIANGKVPYRDFFQHHNPLQWYIFAPFIKMITNAIILLDVAHAIGILVGILTFFMVYKIGKDFFASKYAVLLSILVLCPPYFYIFCFNFNPDIFSALFLTIGIYFLFYFHRNRKLSDLVLSFLSFFIAFMFTQKVLTVLGPLGVISLYIFYKEKISFTTIGYALLLPMLGLMLFLAYLYYENALLIYWKSNYLFNIRMQEYYGYSKVAVTEYKVLLFSGILAFLSIITQWRKEGIFYKTIAILYILESMQRTFYFSIAPYYMLPLMIFACLINSVLIEKICKRYIYIVIIFLSISICYAGISQNRYLLFRGQDRSFAQYVANNITPCDYVISAFLGNQSIISKDPHYYWSLLGHVDIAGEELGIAPKPDINDLIIKYKPKLINGGIYWNNYYLNRGKQVYVQEASPILIEKYYDPTPFQNVYMLKRKYQGQNCHYDSQKKDWVYANQ